MKSKEKLSEEEKKIRHKEIQKKYYYNNKEKIYQQIKKYRKENRERVKERNKKYYNENKEKISQQHEKYCEENREKIEIQRKEYHSRPEVKSKKKERERTYMAKRRLEDPSFKLNQNTSRAIRCSLKFKGLSKNGRHWETLVNYTIKELKEHLENLFQPGMTWKNYGHWHIDHILPLSFFIYTSVDDVEFKYCWSLENLQPLWAVDNIKKKNKIISRKM